MLDTKNIEIDDKVLDFTSREGELDEQIIIMWYSKYYDRMSLEPTRGNEAEESAHTFQLKNCT